MNAQNSNQGFFVSPGRIVTHSLHVLVVTCSPDRDDITPCLLRTASLEGYDEFINLRLRDHPVSLYIICRN